MVSGLIDRSGLSCLIAHLSGGDSEDLGILDQALSHRLMVLPLVVLIELLSDPKLAPAVSQLLKVPPLLETGEGYWKRAAALRAKALSNGRKARLAYTLIASTLGAITSGLLASRTRCGPTTKAFSGSAT